MNRRAGGLQSAAAAGVLFALLLGACSPGPTPTEIEAEPPPAELRADLSFTCGDLIFPAAALSGPIGAERADDPAALALIAFLGRRDPVLEDLPRKEFRVLIASEELVVFATDKPGSSGLAAVLVEHSDAGWAARLMPPCEPRLALGSLNAATWTLAMDEPMPPPDATGFVALVSETECTSGRPAAGRILPPVIVREPTRVLVVFAVRPPPPMPGGLEACPAPPPTPVRVELGEPLGKRELLDGGLFPPRDVQSISCCG
jgi:hypothetical protein